MGQSGGLPGGGVLWAVAKEAVEVQKLWTFRQRELQGDEAVQI